MPRDRSKARELQERKKKGSVDELQLRLEKESEELKQSRLNQKAKIQRIKDRKKQAFLEKVEKDLKEIQQLKNDYSFIQRRITTVADEFKISLTKFNAINEKIQTYEKTKGLSF